MKKIHQLKTEFDIEIFIYDFFKTLLIYIVATLFALCLNSMDVINDNIFGVYMLGVAFTSFVTNGYFWGCIASIGGVIGVNFFFTFPYFALNFWITGYPVTFTILFLIAILVSALTGKVKRAALLSALARKRAETLNEMSKEILTVNHMEQIIELAAKYFHEASQCSVIIYLGSPENPKLKKMKLLQATDERILESALEKQIATSAFRQKTLLGADRNKHTQNCKGTYFPMAAENIVYGVVGFLFDETKPMPENTYSYIDVMISQTILALQRQQVQEEAQRILLETEKEKMRSNLLRAVSHDLRTPLTGILGSAATLLENELDEATGKKMLSDIQQDAEWLIHMVENLLSVTKISGDNTNLKKQEEIVEEVVGEAVARVRKRFPQTMIEVQVPDELLIVPMDATLIEQVLINLMENAIRHSGTSLPISVTVKRKKSGAVFTVSDQGKGINPERLTNIFDGKSTQVSSDSTRGIGIGLSICKSIILAHNGKIVAKNNTHKGASFIFLLPMKGESENVQ